MALSTVAIGTRCSFYARSLTFVMVFLICSSLMAWHELNAIVLYLATDRQT